MIVNNKTTANGSRPLELNINEKRIIAIASIRVKRNTAYPSSQSLTTSESTLNVTETLLPEIQHLCNIVESEPKISDKIIIKTEYDSDSNQLDNEYFTDLIPKVTHQSSGPIVLQSTIANNLLQTKQRPQKHTLPEKKPLKTPLRKRQLKIKPVSSFQKEMLRIARRKLKCQEETNELLRELIKVVKNGSK